MCAQGYNPRQDRRHIGPTRTTTGSAAFAHPGGVSHRRNVRRSILPGRCRTGVRVIRTRWHLVRRPPRGRRGRYIQDPATRRPRASSSHDPAGRPPQPNAAIASRHCGRSRSWWRCCRASRTRLRIEVPGLDGVEFVVKCGARCVFHQAKRSHPSGAWSIAILASAGVLRDIGELLLDNEHRFVFVSGSDARDLADLCEAAADAESLDEFTQKFLDAKKRSSGYDRVLQEWDCGEHGAWSILRRIDVRTINDRELKTKIFWGP